MQVRHEQTKKEHFRVEEIKAVINYNNLSAIC